MNTLQCEPNPNYPRGHSAYVFLSSSAGMPCPCSLPAGYDVTQDNLASEYSLPSQSVL